MSDNVAIIAGLVLLASAPFLLAILMWWRFPTMPYRSICHTLSLALLLFLAGTYVFAELAYRSAGNQDDGSSNMAASLLFAASLLVIPQNCALYLPVFKRQRQREA